MKFTDVLKLLPFLLVTAGIVVFWYDDFVATMVAAIFFWLVIPVALAAIVLFFLSLKRKDTGQKVIVWYGLFNLLLLVAYIAFGAPRQRCDPETMARHYEQHSTELDELCRYAFDALDDSCGVTLEWTHGQISMFHIEKAGQHIKTWSDESIAKQDSLMQAVGLTPDEMKGIRQRMRKTGCIGIEASKANPHTVAVWFRRVGMGRYDFLINDTLLTDEERKEAMDDLSLIPYNERVVFRYGGGAVGPQVFSRTERDEYLDKHHPW